MGDDWQNCLRCGTGKRYTLEEWNDCPWQRAEWRAMTSLPFLPRFIVEFFYLRGEIPHLYQEVRHKRRCATPTAT